MGLERLAAVLQDAQSNYETDLILPIIQATAKRAGIAFNSDDTADIAYRVIADHLRAITFLVSDGVLPSNEGRGYVLRRVLRRALRFGKKLAIEEPFLHQLAGEVVTIMAEAYPELPEHLSVIEQVTQNEEERFFETLKSGLEILEDRLDALEKKGERVIPGDLAFRLYDTYGFPLELTEDIAGEREMTIDHDAFEALLEQQREQARTAWTGQTKEEVSPIYHTLLEKHQLNFVGYDQLRTKTQVLALLKGKDRVERLARGEEGEVLLSVTPFYAEAGGQVGDTGQIASETCVARVTDTFYPVYGLSICSVHVEEGLLSEGDDVTAIVSEPSRQNTMANHTATHLLHAALRHLVGTHVRQAGSLVSPSKLRFDFSHFTSLSRRTIQEVEDLVNQEIRANLLVEISTQDFDDAVKAGAMAIFEEKYGDQVRVVTIADCSTELCGGTHVRRTGEIGVFRILSERGVAAGVRRFEAATGPEGLRFSQESTSLIDQVEEQLHCRADEIPTRIEEFQERFKQQEKEIQRLQLKVAHHQAEKKLDKAKELDGIRFLAERVEELDRASLRNLAEESGVVVLGTTHANRASLVVTVSPDLTPRLKANVIINELADVVGGKGGGRSDLAEAGGKKGQYLDKALSLTESVIREALQQK